LHENDRTLNITEVFQRYFSSK